MADVFAELDEVMRQERIEQFWKENGRMLMTAVLLTVLLTGLISAYRSWDAGVQEKQTGILLDAMDVQHPADGLVKISKDLRPGLRGIALLNAARSLVDEGKKEDAAKIYQQAADDKAIPSDLRDLAVLMSVNLTKATPETQSALLQKLNAVSSDAKSPWRFHARLEAASLLAHTAHDFAGAQEQLKQITSAEDVPPSLKAKAMALSQVYALQTPKAAP